jgi:exodeoxyribonuclease V alpha subunit
MKPQPEPSTQEVLAGLVERVTYHNAENGFCVLRAKARGHRDIVTVVGHAATIAAGEWITASGEWINDRTHGQQFKARFLRTSPPTSADGIEKYLSSGMIRGVGPVYAKKLVRAFGEKVFDVIEATPDRLREVDGIGPVRAASILAAWAEQKAVREIMVFLHSHGVGTARAVRIFKTYGADAIQVMTENPYRLARDIRGIGFKTADAIAMKLGIERTAMIRVRAGISYALTEAMDEGHCGLPTEELIPLAEKLLEVPQELIRTALDLELQGGTVVADRVGETPCVFLAGLHRAERTIAERLMRLANGTLPWPSIDPDKALPWVEKHIGLALADSQVAAIRIALISKVLVMTGGPGVGKTTIVKAILRILAAKGTNLLLCAPTGRAAKRMTEATGFEAKTIHRLLEVDPKGGGFKRGDDNPLDCDLLVVDETSMVDVMLMQSLMKAVPDKAALLLVGDIDQLLLVGPGQVLADVISSGAVPVVRLTEVFRQAAQSHINHQCPSYQPGLDTRSQPARNRERLLLRAGGRPRYDRGAHHRAGEDEDSQTVRPRSHPRHPAALSDEPRRRGCTLAEHRAAGRAQSRPLHLSARQPPRWPGPDQSIRSWRKSKTISNSSLGQNASPAT